MVAATLRRRLLSSSATTTTPCQQLHRCPRPRPRPRPLIRHAHATTRAFAAVRSVDFFSQPNHATTDKDGLLVYDRQYINGSFVPSTAASASPPLLTVTNSNTGEPFASVVAGTAQDATAAIEAASAAFSSWSALPLIERKSYLEAVLIAYDQRSAQITEALQCELGAPHKFAHNVQRALFPLHTREYLDMVDEYPWQTVEGTALVVKEPIGVVGAITPWNWPLNQISVKLAPALLSGCTVILKPSEVTPINAYLLAESIHEAGLPPGVFNMVCGTGDDIGPTLATHPLVDMISFTGSTAVGRTLHALGASTIKRVRTELGGNSASILLDDATEKQIVTMATDVLLNSGQSCNALGRMLAPKSRYSEICDLVKEAFEKVRVVDAFDGTATRHDIGPLSSRGHWEKVRRYIEMGIEEGATLLTGGLELPDDGNLDPNGYFVRPTAFCDVTNDMTIAREEIFGPVLTIIPYETEEEAILMTNDTIYGLSNAIASADEDRAIEIASRLRSGEVCINVANGQGLRAPFGGYKQSGDGREQGVHGLEDFLQIKAINLPRKSRHL